MKKLYFLIAVSLLQFGCVKFEINPGDVVADTVDAGKDLYHTIKRKRNGEEERKYTSYVSSPSESEDAEKNLQCKKNIEANIAISNMKVSKILSESSEVSEEDSVRKIKCEMVVLVVSK